MSPATSQPWTEIDACVDNVVYFYFQWAYIGDQSLIRNSEAIIQDQDGVLWAAATEAAR